jgi:hypothetical protein
VLLAGTHNNSMGKNRMPYEKNVVMRFSVSGVLVRCGRTALQNEKDRIQNVLNKAQNGES